MPTIGPYQLLHALGTCQVGDVWSAADTGNNQVTIAVLKPESAPDPALRDAFAAAASGLAQSGQVPIITSDLQSPTPWIASVAGDGSVVAQIFIALGMAYQPLVPPTSGAMPPAGAPMPPPGPGGYAPQASSGEETQVVPLPPPLPTPQSPPVPPPPPTGPPPPPMAPPPPPGPAPGIPGQAVPPPVSGPPGPVSAPPGPMPPPMPGWAPPSFPDPSPHEYPPVALPPDDSPRRRTGLLIGALVVAVLVLGGGGGAIAFILRPDSGSPEASGTPTPTAPAPLPTEFQPGIEPPVDGSWPEDWAGFGSEDAVTPMNDLQGLGFNFLVPEGWRCTDVSTGDGVAHYTCGPGGATDEIGGDIFVRDCPQPCDGDRRVAMRQTEQAWGLQWYRDGGYRVWAETEQLGGEARYGLVMVGYTPTPEDEGHPERQVVVRMASPPENRDDLRGVATSIRDAIR